MPNEELLPTYAKNLNEAQIQALMHHQGPAMIIAGPGSGKTTVLTGRVQYLITHHNVAPSSILVITYTKAAALSMQQRFIRENKGEVKPVVFGTFHAICYQILKNQYHLKNDCLLSEQEKVQIIKSLLNELKLNIEPEDTDALLGCISTKKTNPEHSLIQIPLSINAECFEKLYHAYCERCKQMGKIDFDDMLLRCCTLFTENKGVLKQWQNIYSYILVDEFQDCDRTQLTILQLLAGDDANLFVVGDDDQSIYGFRGAYPGIMKHFVEIYPQAKKIQLEANYRSRKGIVEASNLVIDENKDRFDKKIYAAGTMDTVSELQNRVSEIDEGSVHIQAFEDKTGEGQYIISKINELSKTIPYEEMAVVFRTNRSADSFVFRLKEAGIPYALKGVRKSPYAHFTVSDIMAYLTAATGVLDRSTLLRIMNKPNRGIERYLLDTEKISLKELAEKYKQLGNQETALEIQHLDRHLERIKGLSPWAAISYVRKVIGYDKWLLERADADTEKYESWTTVLNEVHREAKQFEKISEWLAFARKESKITISNNDDAGVQLMTMHGAKGLEFTYVCIPDVNEGNIPYGKLISERTQEEERRLFYVGMTRAKAALDILYITGTKEYPKLPSRFLNPLLKTEKYNIVRQAE